MEPTIDRDLIFILAEVAVAVTGFAGIAAAIGKPSTEIARWHVRQVVDAGVWTVVLSLLPAFVDLFGLSEPVVWRTSSGIVVLVIASYYALNRASLKIPFDSFLVRLVAGLDFLALVLCAANAFGLLGAYYEPGYMVVLYLFLSQALVYFYLSIQGLWTRAE